MPGGRGRSASVRASARPAAARAARVRGARPGRARRGAGASSLDRVFRITARHPLLVLIVLGVVTLAALLVVVDVPALALRLHIATAVEKILPNEGRDRELYQRFRERFGNDEIVFIGMVTDDVFTADNLRRLQRMTRRFAEVDGVLRVVSLANAPDVRAENGDVAVRSVFDEVPEDEAGLRELRQRVLANPMHVGSLVSADGRTAAFMIHPREMSEAEFRDRGIDSALEQIAREEAPDAEILLAGTPPLKAATSRILYRDLFLFVPLNYLAMALVGFLAFRSLRGVAIPLAAVSLAQVWTLAIMVLADRPLNLVTFIVPPLIIAVGFAYSVHVVSEHEEVVAEGHHGPEAVTEALRRVAFPILLTGLTTAAGFLSLCISDLSAIREFGSFCMVGVIGALFAAFSFAPAVLSLLPDPRPREHVGDGRGLDRLVTRLGSAMIARRNLVLGAGLLVALLATFGLTRLQVSTSFTSNLKESNPLRRDIEAFDRNLAGSVTLHVVMESDERDAFKRPETIRQLLALQRWLDEQPEVTDTTSLADYVMVVNRAFHEGDQAYFTIPDSRRLVGQYLFFFWNDQLTSLVDRTFSSADIVVRIPSKPTQYTARLLDRIEAHLEGVPQGLRAFVTGDTPLIVRTMDNISWGQAKSLSLATLAIFAILAVYFRSARIAALALLPNALPVHVYFGVLGLSGVTLNVITSLIACIVLGIAIDDTIHFMVRYREKARILGDGGKAAVEALRAVARPVTSTTAALCAGFLVLAASGLRHQVEFGILASCMLAFAWLVDVTLTPALCTLIRFGERREAEPIGQTAGRGQLS